MKKVLKSLLLLSLMVLLFISCGKKNEEVVAQKPVVVTSNYPIYDFVEKIAKDTVEVINIIPPGAEPHDWEPTAKDITLFEKADLFVYNGAGMEPWAEDVLESLSNKNLKTLVTSSNVDLIRNEEDEEHDHDHDHDHEHHHHHHHDDHDHDEHDHEHHHHHHGEYDPHIWLSLKNADIISKSIKDKLIEINPDKAEFYEENYKEFSKELAALDEKYTKELAEFKGRNIVVAHEAFAYLCRDYGLNQLGIEGVFAESEPTPKKMKEIVDYVKANNVKVIFFESLASPKVAEAIARETGAETDMLNPIEGLTESEIASGKDYLSIMEDNLSSLKKALSK